MITVAIKMGNHLIDLAEKLGELLGAHLSKEIMAHRINKKVELYKHSFNNYLENDTKIYNIETINEHERFIKLGDKFIRTYYLSVLPNFVLGTSLFKLINLPLPLTLSYHISGTNKTAMLRVARQRQSVLESEQNGRLKKGRSRDPEIDRELEDMNKFINDLVYDFEKTFRVGIYANIIADNEQQLIEYDKRFQDETQDCEFTFNTYSFAQLNAFKSVIPMGKDFIKEEHILQTSALINVLPFLSRNLNDPTGIFFGVNHYNNSLILIDLFKARNANMNIFGTSGSGKSVTAKLIMTRLVIRGIQNIIIDPEGEYKKLTMSLGGTVISFDKDHGIDPFTIFTDTESDIRDYVQVLKNFFTFFIQVQNIDLALLDKVLMQTYYAPGKRNIHKFLAILQMEAQEKNPGFYNDLLQLIQGSLSGLFTNPIVLNFDTEMICFDISGLNTDEKKIPITYLIGCVINKMLNKADRPRMIFIDEAHKLLVNSATTAFYIDLVKTARKRKAGIVSITQNPEDFKESDNSKTIITQAETTILLKQAPASINYIQRFNLFQLTERECVDTSSFAIGEALFIREREHLLLDIFPFINEQEFIFT